jgi:uncharacterized protein YjaG (DUF416 family)
MDSYRDEIKPKLETLSQVNRLLFAVLTCEMLYPNYVFFNKRVDWGDSTVLQDGMILIYQSIFNGGKYKQKDVEVAISNVDMITPDTDDFPGLITSFALDACTSIYSTLTYLIDSNIENIVDVAIYARDTVDMFVQDKGNLKYGDPEIEYKIASDSFMTSEKKRQAELIFKLAHWVDKIDDSTIEQLRIKHAIINLDLVES